MQHLPVATSQQHPSLPITAQPSPPSTRPLLLATTTNDPFPPQSCFPPRRARWAKACLSACPPSSIPS
ncbi:hypothetical protein BKA80DRAFT_278156 [Phyllosticta citrichinensis]